MLPLTAPRQTPAAECDLWGVYTIQQTSSKCIQNTRANAGRSLDRVNTVLVQMLLLLSAPRCIGYVFWFFVYYGVIKT